MNAKHLKLIVASLGLAALIAAVAPSSTYSVPGQKRTRTSTPMKGSKIALRFPDGTTTGFYAWANDPSSTGDKGQPSPVGDVELDAQEILKNATGQSLYFHPGGAFYNDVTNDGQYGHVLSTDLKSKPALTPSGINGKAAPLATNANYLITPTRIPNDMYYKANVVNGSSGSTYYTYGNPGYDKTGGRGDWTYINWSWVQNGGAEYPANITGGGGLVRALGKRNALFRACNVAPIVGYSYGKDNTVNGRVTVFYGLTKAGPLEKGSDIYGWLVQSYQKTGQPLVTCMRRTTQLSSAAPTSGKSTDQLSRMANNLLGESPVDVKTLSTTLADFSKRYTSATNDMDRMEVLTEMSRVESPAMIDLLIEKLASEASPLAREQNIILLGFMRSTNAKLSEVCKAFAKNYRQSKEPAERLRILDVASNIPSKESVKLIENLRQTESSKDATERLAMAEALFKLSSQMPVDHALLADVTAELEQRARDTSDEQLRVQALHLLAAPGQNNREFLAGVAQTETSGKVKAFLTKAIEETPTK